MSAAAKIAGLRHILLAARGLSQRPCRQHTRLARLPEGEDADLEGMGRAGVVADLQGRCIRAPLYRAVDEASVEEAEEVVVVSSGGAIGLCKDSIIMQSKKPSNSDFWRSFSM
jgi:hypothetical protein